MARAPIWHFVVGAVVAAGAASFGVRLAEVVDVTGQSPELLAALGASFGLLGLGALLRWRRDRHRTV